MYHYRVFSIQQKADEVENVINEKENSKIVKLVNEIQKENSKGMIEIHEILEKLRNIDEQSAFDECMQKFIEIDRKIQKDYLSDDEQVRYDLLSKRCSETISEQLQKIERQKNIIYNNEAIESYKIAFQEFKKRESVFKNDLPSLMEMLKKRLFAFDANRLLPETIMYYQNIYKSIFDALSDEGKELLTKTSINVINY